MHEPDFTNCKSIIFFLNKIQINLFTSYCYLKGKKPDFAVQIIQSFLMYYVCGQHILQLVNECEKLEMVVFQIHILIFGNYQYYTYTLLYWVL